MEEELRKLFMELVEFGKEVSPEVWAILIKQQIIHGIVSIIFFIASISLGIVGILILAKQPEWGDEDFVEVMGIVFCVFGVLLIIVSLLYLVMEGIPKLLNPAYYALMSLKP